MRTPIQPEDYREPVCPLCMDTHADERIPVKRIIEKLDEFLNVNDYESAQKHLTYWINEADVMCDERGLLTLYNERMGLFRKLGKKEEAIADANAGLALLEALGLQQNTVAGTTLLNAATVFKSFGLAEQALPLYEKALCVYMQTLSPADSLFGGLYNNMALALVDIGQYDRADKYYQKALSIMKCTPNGELEQAITYLNMADAAVVRYGAEQSESMVSTYIRTAETLLETSTLPRNGYYAFVAEKCAPTFRYYGYFAYARQLEERARRIYEGS